MANNGNEFNVFKNQETGEYFCRKFIGYGSPCDIGTFDDELIARMACVHLNILDRSVRFLRKNFNLNLEMRETK